MGKTLLTEVKSNSLVAMSLHGVRSVLEHELGVTPISIATDETIKAEYLRTGHTEYPYAHLELTEMMGVRDQTANKVVQRLGLHTGLNGVTLATTRKGYIFPVNIGLTLKYTSGDPQDYIAVAESFVILSLIGGLSFEIKLNEDFKFQVRVEVPEQTSIAMAATGEPSQPGAVELEIALIVHAFAGFFRDVAAVKAGNPTINIEINLPGEDDGD